MLKRREKKMKSLSLLEKRSAQNKQLKKEIYGGKTMTISEGAEVMCQSGTDWLRAVVVKIEFDVTHGLTYTVEYANGQNFDKNRRSDQIMKLDEAQRVLHKSFKRVRHNPANGQDAPIDVWLLKCSRGIDAPSTNGSSSDFSGLSEEPLIKSFVEGVELLSPPRLKQEMQAGGPPMDEETIERLRSAKQSKLRITLVKLYHKIKESCGLVPEDVIATLQANVAPMLEGKDITQLKSSAEWRQLQRILEDGLTFSERISERLKELTILALKHMGGKGTSQGVVDTIEANPEMMSLGRKHVRSDGTLVWQNSIKSNITRVAYKTEEKIGSAHVFQLKPEFM